MSGAAQHALPISWVSNGRGVVYLRDVKLNAFATMTRADAPDLAEMLVRAVNRHAQLLAALEMMVRAANVEELDPIVMFAAIEKARAALAAATKGTP